MEQRSDRSLKWRTGALVSVLQGRPSLLPILPDLTQVRYLLRCETVEAQLRNMRLKALSLWEKIHMDVNLLAVCPIAYAAASPDWFRAGESSGFWPNHET